MWLVSGLRESGLVYLSLASFFLSLFTIVLFGRSSLDVHDKIDLYTHLNDKMTYLFTSPPPQ